MNRIPFGLEKATGTLVDVHDVPRGKQSGCICPSCHIDLVARKGELKAWHFAHFTQDKAKEEVHECEYSFYVSVVMMIRQLLDGLESCRIELPTYEKQITVEGMQRWETITKASRVTMKKVGLDQKYDGHVFDILGWVQAKEKIVPLALELEHPEKPIRPYTPSKEPAQIGILAVDLTWLDSLFWETKERSRTFKEVLLSFLLDSKDGKRWLYHRNQRAVEQRAIEKLQQSHRSERERQYSKVTYHTRHITPEALPNSRQPTYICPNCRLAYTHTARFGRRCPRCSSID